MRRARSTLPQDIQARPDPTQATRDHHFLVCVVRVAACAEDEEQDVAGGDLAPFIDGDDAEGRGFDDGVEGRGVVDAGPGVCVCDLAGEGYDEPDCVGRVGEHDDDADDEEADEARFGGVAGGDEADEFAAVAVEAVGEDDWGGVSMAGHGVGGVGRLTGVGGGDERCDGRPHGNQDHAGPAGVVGGKAADDTVYHVANWLDNVIQKDEHERVDPAEENLQCPLLQLAVSTRRYGDIARVHDLGEFTHNHGSRCCGANNASNL